MKRVLGLLGVLAVAGAFCTSHEAFATPDRTTEQLWCVADLDANRLPTDPSPSPFKLVDKRCWKLVGGVWTRGRWRDLLLPTLWIGGDRIQDGIPVTSLVMTQHCSASSVVRNRIVAGGYNPAVNRDSMERNIARNQFPGSMRILFFGTNSATEIVNSNGCCYQKGFQPGTRVRKNAPPVAQQCP